MAHFYHYSKFCHLLENCSIIYQSSSNTFWRNQFRNCAKEWNPWAKKSIFKFKNFWKLLNQKFVPSKTKQQMTFIWKTDPPPSIRKIYFLFFFNTKSTTIMVFSKLSKKLAKISKLIYCLKSCDKIKPYCTLNYDKSYIFYTPYARVN